MIYPNTTGKTAESARLLTLESVWIQGKLRMWGRWSVIGHGRTGNMFNALLASTKISKTAIQQVLSHLKASGMDEQELKTYFLDLLSGKHKSSLAFCTDSEGLIIDNVIAEVLVRGGHDGLFKVINDRYRHRLSKKEMARQLQAKHPEWSLRTCENRIDVYLQVAEFMLYSPMCIQFDKNPQRFRLQSCAGVG
ncbi:MULTISPECIES: DUF1133 family protein [unclassified Pseudescherichia]|uniref:DUF1133 family protein n=1 Tax=Podoviridae sp. ctIlt3 TaxID=2825239 RepID=A0A8S5UA72_9CAUD|nr:MULTISPECIES: DUF1133 family protein [unclassified Pseudescherichia]MCR4456824.1 DUF1133 family protein [Pseudescherichia sp. L3]WPO93979.1 DUF1133 family protein [Buttiauxella sp. HR94]DAF91290.1 MAG TPA: Protein of unknown function (DUF1133) [Podoviridae sp. ctIlt3]HAZ75106.1 hypothetical protein [Enterobacteriaceae bacterium]